jgi:hypothetical protein
MISGFRFPGAKKSSPACFIRNPGMAAAEFIVQFRPYAGMPRMRSRNRIEGIACRDAIGPGGRILRNLLSTFWSIGNDDGR